MFARLFVVTALCFCACASFAIEINELGKGAWSATQPFDNRFNDCNSLIVEAKDFVIVVDAQESADDVRQIIAFANDVIGKPVRYLVNTHWHGDHTQGNTLYREAFGESLVIIGHKTHPDDIRNRAAPALAERLEQTMEALPAAREQLVTGIKRDGSMFTPEELERQTSRVEAAAEWVEANQDTVFTIPSLTVDKSYSVDAGRASFSVLPMRGHTRGDLVIHFPLLGIVATGDLVDVMPYAGHGYPIQWIGALEIIEDLDASVYLPGHGAVLKDTTLITNLISYFASLTSKVMALLESGMSAEEIEAGIDLAAERVLLAGDDERAGRFFDQVQAEAIIRTIEELENTD